MLLVKTYVGPSAVEGVGVFAAEPVAPGAVIWRFDPRFDLLISEAVYRGADPVLQALLERYAYPSPGRPGLLVFEADNGRFMNHADDPNTDFSGDSCGVASRAIAVGEEITCNYREFHEDFELLPGPAEAPSDGGND